METMQWLLFFEIISFMDSIFYGQSFSRVLQNAYKRTETEKGATIFGFYVRDPREYGVVEFDEIG